jgi:hypothetical protein
MTLAKFNFLPDLFWQWVGLNVLGLGIATTLCFSIKVSDFNIEILFLSGLIVGSITGALQPIVLQKRLPRLRYWQWIAANILGGYMGIFGGGTIAAQVASMLSGSLAPSSVSYLSCLVFGACMGLALSITQLVVLLFVGRGILVWSFCNVLGRAIAWVVGAAIALTLMEHFSAPVLFMPAWVSLLAGLVGGGIYGGVTGLALSSLQPKAKKMSAVLVEDEV